MKITKVKWLNDRIAIDYEKEDAAGIAGHFSIDVAARPAPSFFKAMNGLTEHWETSLELPKKKDDLVYGITLSYHAKSGSMSATIQGMRYLEKSNMAHPINSPKKSQPDPDNEDKTSQMSPEFFLQVKRVLSETKKYVTGFKEQTEMELKDEPDIKKKRAV